MTNDPLGLEDSTQMEDLTLMVENFDILNRELDEMSREDDEEINHLKVQIMKIEERKKNLCKPLLIDIERLENKIREFILLAHQGVKVGRWSFGYSVRRSAGYKDA